MAIICITPISWPLPESLLLTRVINGGMTSIAKRITKSLLAGLCEKPDNPKSIRPRQHIILINTVLTIRDHKKHFR